MLNIISMTIFFYSLHLNSGVIYCEFDEVSAFFFFFFIKSYFCALHQLKWRYSSTNNEASDEEKTWKKKPKKHCHHYKSSFWIISAFSKFTNLVQIIFSTDEYMCVVWGCFFKTLNLFSAFPSLWTLLPLPFSVCHFQYKPPMFTYSSKSWILLQNTCCCLCSCLIVYIYNYRARRMSKMLLPQTTNRQKTKFFNGSIIHSASFLFLLLFKFFNS